MKLSHQASYACFAALTMSKVHACWQVHTYFRGDLFVGDTLSMQAYNNGVEECTGGNTIHLSSGDTVWHIACGKIKFTFTNNGRKGHIHGEHTEFLNFTTLPNFANRQMDVSDTTHLWSYTRPM